MNLYFYKPYYSYGNLLETSEQGIYTCRMPDANRRNIDISVGIYREGYNSKLHFYLGLINAEYDTNPHYFS